MKNHHYLVLVLIIFTVLSQSFAKIGARYISLADFSIGQFLNIFIILAFACLAARGIFWLLVLRKFDLSFAYPFTSISYILILAVSHFLFNEPVTPAKIGGCLLITAGVFFISLGEANNRKRNL